MKGQKEEFIKIQNALKQKIVLENAFLEETLKLAAGVDLAYWEQNQKSYAACCIVSIDYKTKQVIEKVHSVGEVKIPYMPGFLAFRELPLVLEAVKKLSKSPDIFLFDGNGYLHQNHMGIATHASFLLNKPTIGVAKSYYQIADTGFSMPADEVGSYTDIVLNSDVYGRALRTRYAVKPVFVSCGNYIDIATATKIVLHFISPDSRIPIPTRMADLETHIVRKKYQAHGLPACEQQLFP